MCRLFGFRSVIQSQVHRSLVEADNALCMQSERHPDGWGVAYYVDGAPHVTKGVTTALHDHLFRRVSGVVSSDTVLAHVRRATVGVPSVLNSHPFQYGRWVFAHNGSVADFERARGPLLDEIAPQFRRFILGETDSELVFYLFLTILSRHGSVAGDRDIDVVMSSLAETVAHVRRVADVPDASVRSTLTLMATNGNTLVATQGGRELFWSSYKRRCGDRDSCRSFAPECEAPTATGFVNHLILASEPLSGENVWLPLAEGDVIGVDGSMRVIHRNVAGERLVALPSRSA